jgi:hypothetical protein
MWLELIESITQLETLERDKNSVFLSGYVNPKHKKNIS